MIKLIGGVYYWYTFAKGFETILCHIVTIMSVFSVCAEAGYCSVVRGQ